MPTIYTITHKSTPNAVYVGLTNAALETRLRQHNQAKNGTDISNWLQELRKQNKIAEIKALATCDQFDAKEQESFWIEQFRSWGYELLNKNENIAKNKKGKYIKVRENNGGKNRRHMSYPKILQFSLNGEFIADYVSVADAAYKTGVEYTTIYRQIRGLTKRPLKFIFKKAA